MRGIIPLAALVGSIFGAILFGIATPTEASALGALGALVLAAAYGRLSLSLLSDVSLRTIRIAAMIGWLLLGASVYAAVFALLGGGKAMAGLLAGLGLSAPQFFWIAQFAIFLLGWPLEWTEITVIFLPLVLPLVAAYRLDPVLFGVVAALNQQASFLAPPVAMSAYYLKAAAGESVSLAHIFAGMLPFLLLQFVAMLIVWLVPGLVYGPIRAAFGT